MALSDRDRHVRYLDLLSYQDKSRRFRRCDPFKPGTKIYAKPRITPDEVQTDGGGNVIGAPMIVEKPCFGIPTAWLRHAHQPPTYIRRLDQKVHNGRCDKCLAADACKKVATERIKNVAQDRRDFRGPIRKWIGAGGLEEGGFAKAFGALGETGWSAVCYPLDTASFTTTNDPNVRAYWRERADEAAKKASGKERFRLRQAWRADEDLDVLRQGLTEGAKERARLLFAVIMGSQRPSYLTSFPQDSITRLCNVWWSREFVRLTGRPINDSQIATVAIEQRRIDMSHSSLRQMVKKDCLRIAKLESAAKYNGGTPIWPKFVHPALA